MRVVLFTGKGGVGKSTVAAGTAALAAARGSRTLVLSTDAAHSLSDAFGVPVGPEPTPVAPHLHVQQVDAQRGLEESWSVVQRYLLDVLHLAGLDPVTAEELTVVPGAEEVLALLELRRQVLSGEWDAVVVDCAPTAETLRLLALPEALGWYLRKVVPADRRVVRALAPLLSRATGVPAPDAEVAGAAERLQLELAEVRALLTGPEASVRLVLTPESVVLAEARRSWTTLSLFGYRVDGVVANRVFPAGPGDAWREGWVRAQEGVLAEAESSFEGLPLWRAGYASAEPVGVAALRDLAFNLYAGRDPLGAVTAAAPFRVERWSGGATLHLSLPFADADQVDLARSGDDLVVTVGAYRRVLALPGVLARMAVRGAGVEEGGLRVRFQATDAGARPGVRPAAPSEAAPESAVAR
ncbi:ArsA family ATPase [Nocardioides aquaticus]|uniref:ArsA family ATPase n=1 Tax=Nocardioides aquaticus TaxID=160826 RepID=UPI0031E43920